MASGLLTMQDTMALTLQDMPNEILDHIIRGLPVPDQLAVSATCTGFCQWYPGAALAQVQRRLVALIFKRIAEFIDLAPVNITEQFQAELRAGQAVLVADCGTPLPVTVTARRGCIDIHLSADIGGITVYNATLTGNARTTSYLYRGAVFWSGAEYLCCAWNLAGPSTQQHSRTWLVRCGQLRRPVYKLILGPEGDICLLSNRGGKIVGGPDSDIAEVARSVARGPDSDIAEVARSVARGPQ